MAVKIKPVPRQGISFSKNINAFLIRLVNYLHPSLL
jgi:hypothetical protein